MILRIRENHSIKTFKGSSNTDATHLLGMVQILTSEVHNFALLANNHPI